MKSSNQIENPLCTFIENLIVKLLSKFQSDPCNNVKVISSLRLKKVVSRKMWEALRGNLWQSLLKKMSYYKAKCMLFLSY